jgi:hypothetical protein
MTSANIKKLLRRKFKTITHFAACAGIPRNDVQSFFQKGKRATKDELRDMLQLIEATEYTPPANKITDKQLEALQKALNSVGGPNQFSKDHPEIAPELDVERRYRKIKFVYDGDRKTVSKFTKLLFSHFGIT